jgi:hypothetical protein
MNRILDILRSPVAMMVALILALTAQGKHTADVFTFFSHPGTPQWLSYAFAAAVEVAVLLFVLNRHKSISYAFAFATFATNMVYYAIGGTALLSVAIVPVVLLSALLPGVIVGYSHTIAESAIADAPTPAPHPAQPRRYRWQFWRKPLEAAASLNHTAAAEQTRYGVPVGTLTAQNVMDAASQPPATTPNQPDAATTPAPALRKAGKPNEYGMTDTQLAELLGVKRQAIAPMRDRGTLTTRVARDLPQLEPVHTNGFNHD